MRKSLRSLIVYLLAVAGLLAAVAGTSVYIDPFFHYHKPFVSRFFYSIDNERSQNDGITKHFDYDTVITGTSMTENFHTSDADQIFSAQSVKVPYAGGSYKEINDNLKTALQTHPETKRVIRCLDMSSFLADKDTMRSDLGDFPTYLYNDNPFDDVKYVLNRDVLYQRCWSMIKTAASGGEPGITSFDSYRNWMSKYTFGREAVQTDEERQHETYVAAYRRYGMGETLMQEQKERIEANFEQNVTSLADEYPDTDFYYFFPPYSAVWWKMILEEGWLSMETEMEQYIIELILPHRNIHLYSWNTVEDLTANLDNYKDAQHYGEWVNTWMLEWMHDGTGMLTQDNYKAYIQEEYDLYSSYDYRQLGIE